MRGSSEMIYLSALPKDEIDLHSDPSCSQSSPPIISTLLTSAPSRLNNENRCSVCTLPILERYILYVDGRAFHCHCLRCSACDVDLGLESSCYTKDGMLLCKRDYYSKYRTSCTKCGSPVLETDFVMRARDFVYHINCFSCAYCGLPLQTGECCGVDSSGAVFCQPHYDAMLLSTAQQMDSKANSKEDNNVPDADNIDYDAEDSNSGGKSKRMRTSFKHHQLRTMKTYFNLNHNPDAKDLKQLAAKTGLTKRVLQVWFQNARAKYRRSMHQRNNSVSPGFGPSVEGNQVGSTSVSSSHSPPTPFGTSQPSVECKAVQDFFDDVNKTINAINNASALL